MWDVGEQYAPISTILGSVWGTLYDIAETISVLGTIASLTAKQDKLSIRMGIPPARVAMTGLPACNVSDTFTLSPRILSLVPCGTDAGVQDEELVDGLQAHEANVGALELQHRLDSGGMYGSLTPALSAYDGSVGTLLFRSCVGDYRRRSRLSARICRDDLLVTSHENGTRSMGPGAVNPKL
ncbi:hypothetical protein CIB48_g7549 [Xylaria polymorpha]|nr:hypothetical protein CIB48_g7549 [Xylaria polymorpha]